MEKDCALCKEKKKLCRSHIIPEFFYTPLYDVKHKISVISTRPEIKNHKVQKGRWEWLLCKDCENKFSQWERYASLVLKGGVELEVENQGNLAIAYGIKYKEFKLFQLSVLWRASISSSNFFEKVSLNRHQEILRNMLHKSDPGESNKYGCLMFGLKGFEGEVATEIIVQPTKSRTEKHICYHFIFGGFCWVYLVSSHRPSALLSSAFLQESGKLIISLQNLYSANWMVEFANRLREMERHEIF